ncbi:hypothetical protein JG687_00009460, partial [Phytophthora cactorum]
QLKSIPPISNVVERFFSVARVTFGHQRHGLCRVPSRLFFFCARTAPTGTQILQYFREHGTIVNFENEENLEGGRWDEEAEHWEKGRWVYWGNKDAAQAALAGHRAAVRYIYQTTEYEDRCDYDKIDGAVIRVSLLFRSKPRFAAIDHVISSVSAYADSSVEFPLNKACKYGSVTLLDRIWNCTVDLEPAVKINKVDIVQWLFEHFPDYGVRRKVIYHAASAGALEILQYFRANGTVITNEEEEQEDDGEWDEEKENWERGRWVRWGGLDAAKAAIAGHSDVVKWMYETYAHTDPKDTMHFMVLPLTGTLSHCNGSKNVENTRRGMLGRCLKQRKQGN